MIGEFQYTDETPALYYAQAAWEFTHDNPVKANDWIASARKTYSKPLNILFAESLYDLGWLKVAAAPSEVIVQAIPTATPKQSAIRGPAPRGDRPWQRWIEEFVRNFIASNETNDVDLALSFFAPHVDLFDEGDKGVEAVRHDIEVYNARWPLRLGAIDGDVRMHESDVNHGYTASLKQDYYVENPDRAEWINGTVAVDLKIEIDKDGLPRIASIKQKTLRRDKGTLQKP
jgi:hypothetical protein